MYAVDPMGGHDRAEGDTGDIDEWYNWPYYILTPKVLEVARNHFNCSNMTGVPLEITGETGQSRLHWEKTVMGNDYMTPSD